MPRKNNYYYSGKPKTSKVLVTLNVIIIVLIVFVLSALGLYSYTFFTGKNPLQSLGIKMPWDDEFVVSQPVVILPEQSETLATMTMTSTEQSQVTANIVLTDKSETTVETVETEPKYNSTEYDKSFFSNSLFIGDSIFTGFSGFGYLEPENVFAQVGLNPESAVTKEIDGVTAVTKAEMMQPDYICIMLGTNGLAFLSAEYMTKEMSELVDKLRAVSPDSEIVILSIPPVTAAHESENPEKIPVIIDYNSKLLKTAEEKDCMYIDIFTMLQDDDGYLAADYAEIDGLHFLGKAYGVVLSRIQYELELKETETSQSEPVEMTNSETGISADTAVTTVDTTVVTESETVTVSFTDIIIETNTEITQ